MEEAKVKIGDQWFYRGNRSNTWLATYREGPAGGLADRVPSVCWPFLEEIVRLQASVRPEAAEMAETLKRLRSQIPGCDCDNPAQCWESCGTLGHSEEHMKVIKDSNKP